MVGATGFEPATSWSQTKCSTRLSYAPTKVVRNTRITPRPSNAFLCPSRCSADFQSAVSPISNRQSVANPGAAWNRARLQPGTTAIQQVGNLRYGVAFCSTPALGMVTFFGMSSTAPVAPQKINLRRPEIMQAVQAQVLSHYRSELVDRIRARGHLLSADGMTIKLAKEFGFCYGVERAIDLAYAARKSFPLDKHIFLLGEIIHNPEVNDQIRNLGIQTIS